MWSREMLGELRTEHLVYTSGRMGLSHALVVPWGTMKWTQPSPGPWYTHKLEVGPMDNSFAAAVVVGTLPPVFENLCNSSIL